MAKLLLVDDEPDTLAVLAEGLHLVLPAPVDVLTALSAEQAKTVLARQQDIDAVICDQQMGSSSGLSLLAWMQQVAHPAKRILLTGHSTSTLPPDLLEAAQPVVVRTKPIALQELASAIRQALG